MHRTTRVRSAAVFLLIAILALTAACGGGGGDSDSKASPTATTAADASSPTAATSNVEPTAPPATQSSEPTATTEPTPTKEPTKESAPATATTSTSSAATATVPDIDEELGDVGTVDPNLMPNFSVKFTLEMSGIPDQDATTMALEMEQSALDSYHIKMINGLAGEGGGFEIWKIGDKGYMAQDGEAPIETPAGFEMFTPSTFLMSSLSFPSDMKVKKDGEDKISGRTATRYRVKAEDILAADILGDGSTVTNVKGDMLMWVDKERDIVLKYDLDSSWTNEDGSEGTMKTHYEITNIDSTPDIQPPAVS